MTPADRQAIIESPDGFAMWLVLQTLAPATVRIESTDKPDPLPIAQRCPPLYDGA